MPITTGRRAFGNRCFMSGGHDRVDVGAVQKNGTTGPAGRSAGRAEDWKRPGVKKIDCNTLIRKVL
jgi:hypothetical protein